MNSDLPVTSDNFSFESLDAFTEMVERRKCVYYASDFLQAGQQELGKVQKAVEHALQVFKTLEVPVEQHFYAVYRGTPEYLYKDWKCSELACLYMMLHGDPTNVNEVARQQSEMINELLKLLNHGYHYVA